MKTKHLIFVLFTTLGSSLVHSQVTPVQLGRASNAFTITRSSQNQVVADDTSGLVAFIHRQDVTIWGGGGAESGKLRYDISTNGGLTFSNDIGVLNNTYTTPARYPQITGYNILQSTNPLQILLPWSASTVSVPSWDGYVTGLSNVVTVGAPTSTENYIEVGNESYITGGLCQGLPGEFWMTSRDFVDPILGDSVRLYKGTYNGGSTDIDWVKYLSVEPNHYLGFDGNSRIVGENMGFSPDGTTGWMAYLGDLIGGQDSTYNPIFMKSTDGGVTWGPFTEIDLNAITYVGDSISLSAELQRLFEPAGGLGSGLATGSFECDLTVDANGNPHMFLSVANATLASGGTPAYSLFTGATKLGIDVTSDDGGITWKAIKIATINTLRGLHGINSLTMDNYPQVSRTSNGSHIFYSWTDSDTSNIAVTSNNDFPDLRIAGLRISDSYQTCPKSISDGDITWGGLMLFPTMAPTVLSDTSATGDYKLPIVAMDMIANDDLQPCAFWYFGNDATLLETDFVAPGAILSMDDCIVDCNPASNYTFVAADFDVVFTNTSTVTSTPTYFWDFGDGNTSTLEDPNHTYAATGTYLVCLTITEACTDSTICNSIVITCVPPTASFTQVSVELDATFSDASTSAGTITDWAWDFGDGNTSTLQNPNHTYLVSGTYTVCLIVTDGCDTNQFCSNVVVVCTAPTANFSQTLASQTATFTDLSTSVGTLTNWAWDFGDAGTSTLQNPVHAYSADGTYTVCLTVTDACDTNEFCFDLVINTIGIDGLNLDGTVALAPNPANGVTWITFSEPTTENLSIVVLNVAGEVILTKEISKQTVNTELNLGTNPSGVYFVRIESENGHSILKLINK